MNKEFKSKSFYPVDNRDGTYRIECRCVIYRASLGKHPSWAKPEGDARLGYNTKYFLLIEDDIQTEADAIKKANEYEAKYGNILVQCEDTGDWRNFPFTNKLIVYYK